MITDINSSLGANLFFNITPEVQAFINTETTSLITNMGADVKHNIQVLVQDSITKGYNKQTLKGMMEQVTSLTTREAGALAKRYNTLFETNYNRLIKDEFSPAQAAKRAKAIAERGRDRYYRQLLNTRKDRIARTELVRAKHKSDISSFNQAIGAGKLKKKKKRWIRTNFKDPWPSSDNDGQVVELNEGFDISNEDGSNQYPAEINELCRLEYIMVPA